MHVFHAFGKPQNKGVWWGGGGGGGSAAQTVRTYGCYTSSLEITIANASSYKDFTTKIHKTRVDPVAI